MIGVKAKWSGRFSDGVAGHRRTFEAAVAAGVAAAGEGMLTELRQEIGRALGHRASNMIGLRVFPEKMASMSAAAVVFSRGAQADRILSAHAAGGVVRPRRASALAIPTQKVPLKRGAGRGAARPMTPVEVEAHFNRELRFAIIRSKGRRLGVLIMDGLTEARSRRGARAKLRRATRRRKLQGREETSVIMFILVRQTRLRQLLDPDRIAARWGERVPDLIERATPADPS